MYSSESNNCIKLSISCLVCTDNLYAWKLYCLMYHVCFYLSKRIIYINICFQCLFIFDLNWSITILWHVVLPCGFAFYQFRIYVSSGLVFLSVFVFSISPIILPITKAVKKHRHPLTYTSILPIFFSLCQSHKIFLSISIVFFSLISFKSAIAFSSYSCLIHCHSIFYRGPASSLHHLCIIYASFLHYAAVLISIPYMLLSVFPVSCNNPCRIPLSKRAYPAFAAYAPCLFLFTALCRPQESHHCCLSYDLYQLPSFFAFKKQPFISNDCLKFPYHP